MKKNIIKIIVIAVAGITILRFFFTPFKDLSRENDPFFVRVRIAHNADRLKFEIQGKYSILDVVTGKWLKEEAIFNSPMVVTVDDKGMKLDGEVFALEQIRVLFLQGQGFCLDDTVYRGDLLVVRTTKGFDAMNIVEMEDYLKGVLPREVNPFWPFSVLKAQAIASRSFAAHAVLKRKKEKYDVTADTYSQVYGGKSAEKRRASKAVEATSGKVLAFNKKILSGYFHSCCGGRTQDIARIWGSEIKPLKGTKCSWCRWTPYFRWQSKVSYQDILDKLNAKGYQLNRVDAIKGGQRDSSGRLKYVRVKSRNKWVEIRTKEFLSIIGRRTLKSANFRIKKYPLFYLFSGYGWGHGVGMCQWGAFGLALRGWSEAKILRHYYPGSKIVNIKEIM